MATLPTHLNQHTGDEPGSDDKSFSRYFVSETFTEFTSDVGWVKSYSLHAHSDATATDPEELTRMLTGFTESLSLITVSELGDKTFCIAMLLAMRFSRRLVFVGVVVALAAMTILSVLVGQILAFLPKSYLHWAEVLLFIGFGLKLLFDAYQMRADSSCDDEVVEAQKAIADAQFMGGRLGKRAGIVLQSFGMTFIAEWGDRTQFATVGLAAFNNAWSVTAGAILGHTICAAIAVMGGRWIAGYLSERVITLLGGLLFILFGLIAALEKV